MSRRRGRRSRVNNAAYRTKQRALPPYSFTSFTPYSLKVQSDIDEERASVCIAKVVARDVDEPQVVA